VTVAGAATAVLLIAGAVLVLIRRAVAAVGHRHVGA